ncbi:uncharacterized protein TRIVIDRAFT_204382 [Trichoderma virens Gv29-8]|uniref:Uncharacterized protein n=1 Tax=Hypocrea virens (strain Gv29-8 / FGSC 10586) TaxID=413071 RepID=G9N2S6_HYPVG|nr:uncharacterized protein TRIVIDRAFT_204382 [Trichoderma virens Gv29-8]EHK18986.1 hypothetical protein TRIVIDRAFT_204382 [Trichoderma virens Gv29-8]
MDNTGHGPLRVPGFGDMPLEEKLRCEQRFAHGFEEWQQMPAVTVRELAMVAVMNTLTDKPGWHIDIFNEDIATEWRKEAFAATPLMSEKAWAWCIAELRDKANEYTQKQYIRVLDTGSCVCKSDILVPTALSVEFKSEIEPLLPTQIARDQISSIVDPSLYPLVYGRSLVLLDGGEVVLEDVFGSYDKAKTAPKHFERRFNSPALQAHIERCRTDPWKGAFHQEKHLRDILTYFWSCNFQWLPCEVEFIGNTGADVQITSYINNLHPAQKSLYRNLEKLISLAIRPWNDCLIKGQRGWRKAYDNNRSQRGPVPLRIVTYGVEWEDELPEWSKAFDRVRRHRLDNYLASVELLRSHQESTDDPDMQKRLQTAKRKVEMYRNMEGAHPIPEPTPELWEMAQVYLQRPNIGSSVPAILPENWKENTWRLLLDKNKKLLRFRHPEPGTAFSYDEWKSGTNNDRAVVDMVTERFGNPHHSPTSSYHNPYVIRLEETFRNQGLQVVIKISGIELTPENPKYHGSTWDIEGQMNEHIVAAAVYAYDVHNVTESRIAFRQETSLNSNFYQYGPDLQEQKDNNMWNRPAKRWSTSSVEVGAIGEIFGFTWEELSRDIPDYILPFQEIGRVTMPQGRLIAFPNTMEYRREPFELLDPAVPGHHRWVTLLLVDPNYRICSTRNVPPQQQDWWKNRTSDTLVGQGSLGETRGHHGPMSPSEAEAIQRDMMKEHKWMQVARYHLMTPYTFC